MTTPISSDITTVDLMWRRLAAFLGFKDPGGFPTTLLADGLDTTEAKTIYVDPTLGNDSNPGTSDLPFATPTAALDSIAGKRLRHLITIQLASGNYSGFWVNGFTTDPLNDGTQCGLLIKGTMVNATVTTGSATGTSTTAANGSTTTPSYATMTDSGATWTTNDLVGKMLRVDTTTPQYHVIVSNTSTQITVATCLWATSQIPTSSTYAILDWGTVINAPTKIPASVAATGAATAAATNILGIGFHALTGSTRNTNYKLEFVKTSFTATNGIHLLVEASPVIFLAARCCFTGLTSGNFISTVDPCRFFLSQSYLSTTGNINYATSAGNNTFTNCFFDQKTAGSSFGIVPGTANTLVSVGQCKFSAMGSGISPTAAVCVLTVSSSMFASCTTGVSIINTTNRSVAGSTLEFSASTGTTFDSCTTAIQIEGHNMISGTGDVKGSGNTTAINLSRGGRMSLTAASTITGSSEIVLDGAAAQTVASMRSASPKLLSNTYGTIIYET